MLHNRFHVDILHIVVTMKRITNQAREDIMATQKLTKMDKDLIAIALQLKINSCRRAANSNDSPVVKQAFEQECTAYEALRGKILGQGDLEV